MLRLESAYRNGTTQPAMSPLEFRQRLAALVPRSHRIRFHGVLAPYTKLRAEIVPTPAQMPAEHAQLHARDPCPQCE